jgi:glutathione S-transferase
MDCFATLATTVPHETEFVAARCDFLFNPTRRALEGNAMLKIWGRANSSNVQKVLWGCEEIGIAFERIDAGGAFGRTNEPAYLKMNPNGLVPTVEDGKTILWESNTILRYLATTRGADALYPKDPVQRAMTERWMDWQLASLNPPMTVLLFGHYRTPPEQRNAAALEDGRQKAIGVWRILETCLGDTGFAAGAALTLADICLGNAVHRWHSYPIERPALPRLKRYYDRLAERPGYRKHIVGPIT